MKRRLISSGSDFEKKVGYSRAVIQGNWLFMAGTTGFDYEKMTISDDIVDQTRQTLQNIDHTLEKAGFNREDIVKVMYILPNASEFELCWTILREYFGEALPAATMISAALFDPRMKIEIEVTAIKKGEPN